LVKGNSSTDLSGLNSRSLIFFFRVDILKSDATGEDLKLRYKVQEMTRK